jgi:hypothetical protein
MTVHMFRVGVHACSQVSANFLQEMIGGGGGGRGKRTDGGAGWWGVGGVEECLESCQWKCLRCHHLSLHTLSQNSSQEVRQKGKEREREIERKIVKQRYT